jgi:hypothetical protein
MFFFLSLFSLAVGRASFRFQRHISSDSYCDYFSDSTLWVYIDYLESSNAQPRECVDPESVADSSSELQCVKSFCTRLCNLKRISGCPGLSSGAVAAIVIVVLIIVGATGATCWYFFCRPKSTAGTNPGGTVPLPAGNPSVAYPCQPQGGSSYYATDATSQAPPAYPAPPGAYPTAPGAYPAPPPGYGGYGGQQLAYPPAPPPDGYRAPEYGGDKMAYPPPPPPPAADYPPQMSQYAPTVGYSPGGDYC